MRVAANAWILVVAWLALVASSRGDLVVAVGDHILLPNAPEQEISIFVSGGDLIAGLNFNVQIEDGFPEVPDSTRDGPNIIEIDIIGTRHSTIFTGNNSGQQDPGSGGQTVFRRTTTESGGVPASGLLATVVVDTTGFSEGEFTLRLNSVFGGPTSFVDPQANLVPATITDGTIRIGKLAQTISFEAPRYVLLAKGPIQLAASSSAGLPVSFEFISGPGTLDDGKLDLTGAGNVLVRAIQAGDSRYEAAPPVEQIIRIVDANEPKLSVSGEDLMLSATAGFDYQIEFTTALIAPIQWTNIVRLSLTNQVYTLPLIRPGFREQGYYRALLLFDGGPSAQPQR